MAAVVKLSVILRHHSMHVKDLEFKNAISPPNFHLSLDTLRLTKPQFLNYYHNYGLIFITRSDAICYRTRAGHAAWQPTGPMRQKLYSLNRPSQNVILRSQSKVTHQPCTHSGKALPTCMLKLVILN